LPSREQISTSRPHTSGIRTSAPGSVWSSSGIRRALLRRFPYAVYFAVERDVVVILAVLHVSRDPAEWQRRRA
jgi:plasmid stabilization system protein ParE